MNTTILGIHHVTAITARPQANIDFYTGTLGLRLVKLTVNYDDPASYHLYYGDGLGRPGTVMTFFAWPGGREGRAGTGQVTATAFAIPAGSLDYWQNRLPEAVRTERFGQTVLSLVDPDGLPIELVETPADDLHVWPHGGVPAEHAIRGFAGVTLTETTAALPAGVLVDRFGYRLAGQDGTRTRFALDGNGPGRVVDVITAASRSAPATGAGQVHHVAFRTPDDAQQQAWLDRLLADGKQVSPVMDRDYFHSIYFREPGGTLFEIATEGPGFTKNEPAEALGAKLVLPAWLEPVRADLERVLPPLRLPSGAPATHAPVGGAA